MVKGINAPSKVEEKLCVHQLVVAFSASGAGEIPLRCTDRDGANSSFDLDLIDSDKPVT